MKPLFDQPVPFVACLLPAAVITLSLVLIAESHFRLQPRAVSAPAAHGRQAESLPPVQTVCTLD